MKSFLAAALLLGGAFAPQAGAQSQDRPPARDSRGIPVVSNPAEAPAGANGMPSPSGTAPDPRTVFAPRPSAGDYPACTRQVTDNCKQVHEVGRGPR